VMMGRMNNNKAHMNTYLDEFGENRLEPVLECQ
jgi:hypothetical protein